MDKFYSPTGKVFTQKTLLEEILFYINSQPQAKYKIIIGTDSNSHETIDFVSAVVVYRVGHGGRFFWKRIKDNKKKMILRERIYQEVIMSLNLAENLLKELSLNKHINYDFEIHVDVGSNGETKEMLQEIIGVVKGSGYEVKTKPESYGASKVADRYT
ncbi:MAG: ribonuclease H-like YkuK family protein [Minisyncoccia bacterium]